LSLVRRLPAVVCALALSVLGVLAVAATAQASSTPPSFGAPTLLETLAPFAQGTTGLADLSCGSPTSCVAVGGEFAERTTDAGTATTPVWSAAEVITPSNAVSVSCPTSSLCLAFADDGTTVRSTDGGMQCSQPVSIETGAQVQNGACTRAGVCLASGESSFGVGQLYVSTDQGQTWSGPDSTPNSDAFGSLSCPSNRVCVATSLGGDQVLVSTDVGDAGGPTWTATTLSQSSGSFLTDVSCTANDICVAVDTLGYAFVSTDVSSSSPSWKPMLIVGTGSYGAGLVGLESVSCAERAVDPTTDLCVTGDFVGSTVISTNVGGTGPSTWSIVPTWDTGVIQSADGNLLYPIACVGTGWCAVADTGGNVTYALVPLSDPAGTVWSTPPGTITGADRMSAVSCSPNGQSCAALDTTGHAVTSIDGGANWSPAATVDHFDPQGRP